MKLSGAASTIIVKEARKAEIIASRHNAAAGAARALLAHRMAARLGAETATRLGMAQNACLSKRRWRHRGREMMSCYLAIVAASQKRAYVRGR